LVVHFWNEGSGWFFCLFSGWLWDTGFCHLIGSKSSDVIGWCYKTFQSSFEFENKRRSVNAFDIYILQNDTIIELVTSSMNAALHKSLYIGRWHSRGGLKSLKIGSLEIFRFFGHVRVK
jgi:hypothetical protein